MYGLLLPEVRGPHLLPPSTSGAMLHTSWRGNGEAFNLPQLRAELPPRFNNSSKAFSPLPANTCLAVSWDRICIAPLKFVAGPVGMSSERPGLLHARRCAKPCRGAGKVLALRGGAESQFYQNKA